MVMTIEDIREKVIQGLEENGVILLDQEDDLRDRFEDSIHFMSSVIFLEESLGITFPPELINDDFFLSLEGLCQTIASLLSANDVPLSE